MAERCLNKMDRRTAVKGVGSMGVTEPVWGHRSGNVGACCRLAEDHPYTPAIETFSAVGSKDQILGGSRTAQRQQFAP